MSNTAPFNILMAVGDVFIAPLGTAFPDPDEAPSGSWSKLGTLGVEDFTDDGVTITSEQEINEVYGAGSTVARKISRVTEGATVALTLMDMTLEQVRHALNENAITTTAAASGTPGTKSVKLYQGVDVSVYALLVRNHSPYSGDAGSYLQYQLPAVYQSGNPEVTFNKGEAAGIAMEWKTIRDPNASSITDSMGKIIAYTAAAL
jgi:hypothetical protein